jgi:hypothetical protein
VLRLYSFNGIIIALLRANEAGQFFESKFKIRGGDYIARQAA